MSVSSGLMSSWQKIQRIYTKTQRLPVTINAESSAVISEYMEANCLAFGKHEKVKHVSTNATSVLLIFRTVPNKEDSLAKLN